MHRPHGGGGSNLRSGFATYAHLHLDSMTKVISHIVGLALICEVLLMFATFSVSFIDHRLGFSPSFCTFLLGIVSLIIIFVLNNQRMSILPSLSPTEHMIGVVTGLSIGAAFFAWLISSTYASPVCVEAAATPSHTRFLQHTNTTTTNSSTSTTTPSPVPTNINDMTSMVDPVVVAACADHQSTAYAIWFWAGLAAWLHAITAIMLWVGRVELATNSPVYESMGGSAAATPPPPMDFEEAFRRQQQQILGESQAAAIQHRAASMFVGDYSTIPEVTQGQSGSVHGV